LKTPTISLLNFMNDSKVTVGHYARGFSQLFPELVSEFAWIITTNLSDIIAKRIRALSADYNINGNVAIHKTARIEENVVFKGPMIISAGTFIGAHAYLRGGVFLDQQVSIGPGCEVKSSLIMAQSALAHFNFVGDSVLGSMVNMEAGSIVANHFNERTDKTIHIVVNGQRTALPTTKFGALVGDETKIGANAVLSPGTILEAGSIVPRLGLVAQS